MGKTKTKRKKKKSSKIIKAILLIVLFIFSIALVISIPQILELRKLYKQACAYVDSSSKSTFMNSKTTMIYDINGNELCSMRNSKELYYKEYKEIPNTLIDAFIVMEDKNYYKHSGFDIKAIIRAVIENNKTNRISQGASTITQQLARNIFLSQEVTWERKIQEIFIATQLDKKYTKDDILEFYVNNIYFGNGNYGVEAAARGYFNKSVGELSLKQQVFIAAIPNNPTKYNPLTNMENTLQRCDLILDKLYEADDISSMDYYTAKQEEIVLSQPKQIEINDSVVTYVRHCATESMMLASGFSLRYSFSDDNDYEAYKNSYETYYTLCQQKLLSGGYTVYTSIDPQIQEQLQRAVDNNCSHYTETNEEGIYKMQAAATCIDNLTGNVVAIVGSRTQDDVSFGLNRAYQSYRQPGSSIKPLSVYTPYLQLGNSPDTIVTDERIEGGPSNADLSYAGDITLRQAVEASKNTVAWKIYQQITPKSGCGFLIRMGFKKVWMDKEVNSAALGGFTYGVTTEEMAAGYAAIENDGVYRRPTCVQRILDSQSCIIRNEENRDIRVYEVNASRMMTDMLVSVVEEGTGMGAKVDEAIVAGKTGTTNSNKDSWFCGFSRYYTTSIWTGYDYPKEMSDGGVRTKNAFKQFMSVIHEGLPKTEFKKYTEYIHNPKEEETEAETTREIDEEETRWDNIRPSDDLRNEGETQMQSEASENTSSFDNSSSTEKESSIDNIESTTKVPQGEWDATIGTKGEWDSPDIRGD